MSYSVQAYSLRLLLAFFLVPLPFITEKTFH